MIEKKKYLAPRTCTVVDEHDLRPDRGKKTPLSEYAEAGAYVLIAEPGAGKTTAFETESSKPGDVYVSVRDFLALDKPEWCGKTLFLDGLDESRAGTSDGRTPLDEVRTKLNLLGCPRFRLSCRWADWLAANDRERLRAVSPDGKVTVVRLDPLSRRAIKDILERNHDVEDPEGFIAAAKDRGIEGLLSNPQNLELIARAVAGGKWPDSRREMFEEACRLLVRETNGEHLAAKPSAAEAEPLLWASGRLCAVQLLSGSAGYTLPDRAEPDDEYPSLSVIGDDPDGRARQVLGTRLFVGVTEGKLAPTHRQIAEFLAARHVSVLVDEVLPLARVLALISGFDGEVMPGFRNFLSWLAVHNKRSRKSIIRLDPSGLIYTGDRETYSTDEKREIVLNLRREWTHNPYCSRSMGKVSGFGRIVSPELEGTFKEILSDTDRNHEHQCYVLLLTQMLADGAPLPTASEVLLDIVRDVSWYPSVRSGALSVLTRYSDEGCLESAVLEILVREIDDGSIVDADDELLGILLKSLYPRVLSMKQVLKHLREPKLKTMIGEYSRFWTEHVRRESTSEQLAELLDGIAGNRDHCRKFMSGEIGRNTRMAQLLKEAFEEVLRPGRGPVAAERLYDWLGMFSENEGQAFDIDVARLRSRLVWDEKLLKDLIAHGVGECVAVGDDCTEVIDWRLGGVRPFRYGRWCLEKALTAENPKAAAFYLRELHVCVTDGRRAEGLTIESVRGALAGNASLREEFERMPKAAADTNGHRTASTLQESTDGKEEIRPDSFVPVEKEPSTPDWREVGPRDLHRAAEAYLGIDENAKGGTALKRLAEFARQSRFSTDVLREAMEQSVHRANLPECDDVVRLFDEKQVNLLVLPLMAGLHSLEKSGRLSVTDLDEGLRRLAVTILYTLPQQLVDPDNVDGIRTYRPEWFQHLLRDSPALVSDVLCRTALRKLETGIQQPTELYEMATAADHEAVAKLEALRVLEQFPKAETEASLLGLCWTLRAAFACCDWSTAERVIRERLERGGLEASERSCRVAAGYLIAPERFREEFQTLVTHREELKWLAEFLSVKRLRLNFASHFGAEDVVLLVATVGLAYRKQGLTQDVYWSIADAISVLEKDASDAAVEALERLAEAQDAEPWMPAIKSTREMQARRRRENEYRHSSIGKVVLTLGNGNPANAGDLAALVLDQLTEIAAKIRHGSTNDWRQHWNVDEYNRAIDPKPEDACRDAILSDLQERLEPLGVDAQPEGAYADDKRADIRVSFDNFDVPVEIKRSCHEDLWTAIQTQLIAKYTRSPGASGCGIYLVFWFGDEDECKPTKYSGWIPQSTDELRGKLQELVPEDKKNLISICITDVSVPRDKKKGRRLARKG